MKLLRLAASLAPASVIAFAGLQALEAENEQDKVVRHAADTTGCLDTLHASDTITAMATIRLLPYNSKTRLTKRL